MTGTTQTGVGTGVPVRYSTEAPGSQSVVTVAQVADSRCTRMRTTSSSAATGTGRVQ